MGEKIKYHIERIVILARHHEIARLYFIECLFVFCPHAYVVPAIVAVIVVTEYAKRRKK